MKNIISKFKEMKREKTKSEIRQYFLENEFETAASIAEKEGFPGTAMILYSRLAKTNENNYFKRTKFYNKSAQIAENNNLKRKALDYFKKADNFEDKKRIIFELKDLEEYSKLYRAMPGFMPYLLEDNCEKVSDFEGDRRKIERDVAINAVRGFRDEGYTQEKEYLGPTVRLLNSIGRKKLANSLVDKFKDQASKEKRIFNEQQNRKINDLERHYLIEKKELEEKYESKKVYLEEDKESKLKSFQNDLDDFQNLKNSLEENKLESIARGEK